MFGETIAKYFDWGIRSAWEIDRTVNSNSIFVEAVFEGVSNVENLGMRHNCSGGAGIDEGGALPLADSYYDDRTADIRAYLLSMSWGTFWWS